MNIDFSLREFIEYVNDYKNLFSGKIITCYIFLNNEHFSIGDYDYFIRGLKNEIKEIDDIICLNKKKDEFSMYFKINGNNFNLNIIGNFRNFSLDDIRGVRINFVGFHKLGKCGSSELLNDLNPFF